MGLRLLKTSDVNLPISLREYDDILNSIRNPKATSGFLYGSDTALILADRLQDADMPRHEKLFRTERTDLGHPYHCLPLLEDVWCMEEILSWIHYRVSTYTRWRIQNPTRLIRQEFMSRGVRVSYESTMDNPILLETAND